MSTPIRVDTSAATRRGVYAISGVSRNCSCSFMTGLLIGGIRLCHRCGIGEVLVVAAYHHDCCNYRYYAGKHIACCHARPYTGDVPYPWQYQQEWDKKQQLPCQAEEYRQLRFAYGLKKVLNDNLTTNDRIAYEIHTESGTCYVDQRFVGCKHSAHLVGKQFGYQKAGSSDKNAYPDTDIQCALDSLPVVGSEVVAEYGLHSLGHAEYYHYKKHSTPG